MNKINIYYEILGLQPGASQVQIKEAYRKQARTWHPDRFPNNPQLKQKAEEEFKKINEAYQQLKLYQVEAQPIPAPKTANHKTAPTRVYYHSVSPETYYNQGVDNVQSGRYQEALEDFTQAIRLNPYYIEAYRYRGFVCSQLGYAHRAKSDLRKVVELKFQQPKTAPSYQAKTTTTHSYSSHSPWKCVNTLTGHSSLVASVALSQDGRTIASGSFDTTIKLWQLSTGELINTLTGHTKQVRCVNFSPDGHTIVSSSFDKTIKLWQVNNGKLKDNFTGHSDEVWSVVISPNSKTLVSGSRDKTIKIWDLTTGRSLPTHLGHSDVVSALAISPNGQLLASGSFDKTIKIWHLGMGQFLRLLKGHSSLVTSIAFSRDGQMLASSGLTEIKLWQTNGKEICTLKGHLDAVYSVAFSPDGKMLASGSFDKTIKIWQLSTCREIYTLTGHSDWVSSVVFSKNSQTLVSGSSDKTIKIWQCS
ncbi:MAG: DnaJ domain-containing protein [Coleofasciculaceae cyanobacterium]